MFDVSRAVPEAQPIVEAAAQVYHRHTHPWLTGILLHGSALKGGYIPHCSDVDMQLYLKDEAFDADGQLPLTVTLAIHRELARRSTHFIIDKHVRHGRMICKIQ